MGRNPLLSVFFLSLILGHTSFAQGKKKQIHEVSVVKFDNYAKADGEQKIFSKRYLQDTTGTDVAPVFDILYSVSNFSFPPANDTLLNTLAHKPTPQFKPAEFDPQKRLTGYYRSAFEHYTFEYNSFGNLVYIKRWGAKHVTAQMTFIYYY